MKAFICEDLLGLYNGDEIMGSSECEICKENDYLDGYILEDEGHSIEYRVCRNCVEEGLKLRIKQMVGMKKWE